jgi:hypothetical protein
MKPAGYFMFIFPPNPKDPTNKSDLILPKTKIRLTHESNKWREPN